MAQITGNLNGIKKTYINLLNELCCENYESKEFVNYNLLNEVCKISVAIGKEIGLKVARNGELLELIVGNCDSVSFESPKGVNKFNGIRFIHTHPNGNPNLSNMDISALKNNMLDCICAVALDNSGYMLSLTVGINGEKGVEIYQYKNCYELNNSNILTLILEAEQLVKKSSASTYSTETDSKKAISVLVSFNNKQDVKADLIELKELAQTAGVEVVDSVTQNRKSPDNAFVIGIGKLDEIKEKLQLTGANLVIFDNELSGSKLNNLETQLGVKVIDRSMLILDIFAGRAKSNEGKLQVALAQAKFSLPRLSGLSGTSGRFGGGIGMRGPGETKLELERRVIEKNIVKLQKQLAGLHNGRKLRREKRLTNNQKTVSLVGYTNSGKSTLLNTITKANVYAKDQLFATLDTTTRFVWVNEQQNFLLTDTVGFISKLPHEFIEAFASTLEETVFANLLLHVVDASNPNFENQMQVVNEVLKKIEADSIPCLVVFNKIDKVPNFKVPQGIGNYVCVSAKENIGLDKLKQKITEMLYK